MRVRSLSALVVALTALTVPTAVRAQTVDGATVFRGNCATCHDGAATSRSPSPEQLRARSPESIIAALTGGAMGSTDWTGVAPAFRRTSSGPAEAGPYALRRGQVRLKPDPTYEAGRAGGL